MSKTILITGGAGFVGSSLAISIKEKGPELKVISFDNLKRRGSDINLSRLRTAGVDFVHGDVRNKEDFDALPKVDLVIDAAAEPSVTAGIAATPDYVVNTNLTGTINCLNFAAKHRSNFIFLSTSRVYPIQKIEQIHFAEDRTRFSIAAGQVMPGVSEKGITEEFPLDGHRSIYGATKLCSEILIGEYAQVYGLKTVINRCGVITGPWQMGKVDQGVVVLWAARHLWKGRLEYFGYGGTGKQVRDILHVNDLSDLISLQMGDMDKFCGETFNVGGGRENSVSLLELTELCRNISGNDFPIGSKPEPRPADVRMYITDNSKVTQTIGWKPKTGVEEIIEDVFRWIEDNKKSLEPIIRY